MRKPKIEIPLRDTLTEIENHMITDIRNSIKSDYEDKEKQVIDSITEYCKSVSATQSIKFLTDSIRDIENDSY